MPVDWELRVYTTPLSLCSHLDGLLPKVIVSAECCNFEWRIVMDVEKCFLCKTSPADLKNPLHVSMQRVSRKSDNSAVNIREYITVFVASCAPCKARALNETVKKARASLIAIILCTIGGLIGGWPDSILGGAISGFGAGFFLAIAISAVIVDNKVILEHPEVKSLMAQGWRKP